MNLKKSECIQKKCIQKKYPLYACCLVFISKSWPETHVLSTCLCTESYMFRTCSHHFNYISGARETSIKLVPSVSTTLSQKTHES